MTIGDDITPTPTEVLHAIKEKLAELDRRYLRQPEAGYFHMDPQPNPADTFLATLRESLAEFDQRLLALEKAVSRKPIIEAGDIVLCLQGDGGFYEVTATRPGELLIGGNWLPADRFVFSSRPDREHHEAEPTAENDDFLAPPLPWWARSPKVG